MKSYTDLKTSKELEKILDHRTADFSWRGSWNEGKKEMEYSFNPVPHSLQSYIGIPCWSLSALLSVLPKVEAEEPMIKKLYYAAEPKERYICFYGSSNMTGEYDNPVDAVVEMIRRLLVL